MDDEQARVAAEVERQLAQARRDMERDFEARRREAKLQEKRGRDRLHQEQEEWEAYRREQAKVLADKAETLRSRQESAKREGALKQRAREDLVAAKVDVDLQRAATEAARQELEAQVTSLEAGFAKSAALGRVGRIVLAASGLVMLALSAGWVKTWWSYAAGVVALGAALVLHLMAPRHPAR